MSIPDLWTNSLLYENSWFIQEIYLIISYSFDYPSIPLLLWWTMYDIRPQWPHAFLSGYECFPIVLLFYVWSNMCHFTAKFYFCQTIWMMSDVIFGLEKWIWIWSSISNSIYYHSVGLLYALRFLWSFLLSHPFSFFLILCFPVSVAHTFSSSILCFVQHGPEVGLLYDAYNN